MPNHVTTICEITGPKHERDELQLSIGKFDPTDYSVLDFNKITSTPKSIDGTMSGTAASEGILALTGKDVRRWHDSIEELNPEQRLAILDKLVADNPECLLEGAKCLVARKETGYDNWYDWNMAHWGTKWNAYECEMREDNTNETVYKFMTAWSFPEPIFKKLAEQWPNLVFSFKSIDEGLGFACVGELNGVDDFRYIDSDDSEIEKIADEVYGYQR